MNDDGARTLIRTLLDRGVDTCFTNPGTSEIHVVAALDSAPGMRAVLTVFEGVATGAADGYARMTGSPAATVLHLGAGLANGLANLHNARRARVPLLNIVGDQATHHVAHDAPLQSDIETIARNVSPWVRTSTSPEVLTRDTLEAITAATGPPSCVATLIVPADVAWRTTPEPATPLPQPPEHDRPTVDESAIEDVARTIRSGRATGLLLGGSALRERGLVAAARIAAATGVRLLAEMFPARMQRGAGRPAIERLLYWPELASAQLEGLRELILVDTTPPVAFFAYPGRDGSLVASDCTIAELTPAGGGGAIAALEALAQALDAGDAAPALAPAQAPVASAPTGALNAEMVCRVVGACLPEGAIVSDEAITSGVALPAATVGAPPHDWLTLTGGAIGQGLPVAVGAAVACPDRPVIALQADGSALYTFQSLWTMAREGLDVTVVLFNNRAYNILGAELARAGVTDPGAAAAAQLRLADPDIDFTALATGLGIPAGRADTAAALDAQLRRALAEPGPHLIEVVVPAEPAPAAILAQAQRASAA